MNTVKTGFENFRADLHGFNYYYEKEVPADTTIILKVPVVSANKRSVSDIGWMVECDNDADTENVVVSGTLSSDPCGDTAMWQELMPGEDANKTLSGIKISNKSANPCRVCVRVILC